MTGESRIDIRVRPHLRRLDLIAEVLLGLRHPEREVGEHHVLAPEGDSSPWLSAAVDAGMASCCTSARAGRTRKGRRRPFRTSVGGRSRVGGGKPGGLFGFGRKPGTAIDPDWYYVLPSSASLGGAAPGTQNPGWTMERAPGRGTALPRVALPAAARGSVATSPGSGSADQPKRGLPR